VWRLACSLLLTGAVPLTLGCSDSGEDAATVNWDRATVLPDGRIEFVYSSDDYKSESCWAADPRFEYTPDTVAVELRFRRIEEFCTLELPLDEATVVITAPQPIGDRTIVPL
jgi:hypothetical protein